jgi:hypothetical protein
MSYSFQVKAATKAEAKAAVEAEFDKVVEQQPEHARDKAAALANANASIDLLADDDTQDVSVSCNGYISWCVEDNAPGPLTAVSVAAQAYHAPRD